MAFKIEVQVKVGSILKSTKECYLGKTIDDNLIVFDRTVINKDKAKEAIKKKEIYKHGKTKNFSIGKRSDSSICLIEKTKSFFGLFES